MARHVSEATVRQRAELERLQIAAVRRMYLRWLERARREPSVEPAPSGFARPPVAFVEPLDGGADPLPVVRGEIVTPSYDGARLERLTGILARFGFTFDAERSDRVLRFGAAGDGDVEAAAAADEPPPLPVDTATGQALRAVRAAGLRADPVHLLSLAWDMKGGAATAEPADTAPTPLDRCDGTPLVVVVDTGLHGGAGDRTDGLLDTVSMHQPDDEDLLDVLNPAGAVASDERLDLAAGHGTFVAGIVTQVAPGAEVVAIKALATDGAGTDTQLAAAIDRAATVFADRDGRGVLNLSLGAVTWNDQLPHQIAVALDGLPPDVLVVAAAGNTFGTRPVFPAADPRVLAVAAVDAGGNPTTWSCHGPWVDFSTTGEGLVSAFVPGTETAGTDADDPFDNEPDTFPDENPTATWVGTSFAAPQVAARLACHIAEHPDRPASEAVPALRLQGVVHPDLGHVVEIL